MGKNSGSFIEKLFRLRILLLVLILFLVFICIGFYFNYDTGLNSGNDATDNIYQTWKVQRFYKNGKLVVNDKKFQNLRFRVNKDSTAEWIRPSNTLKLKLWLTTDGTQIIKDNGESIEDIETVYELKKNKLRFGKRNVMSHYEYVMVPEGMEK